MNDATEHRILSSLEKLREHLIVSVQQLDYLIMQYYPPEDNREHLPDGYYYGENCETCPYAPMDHVDEER